jgi:hypothetical protein
VGHIANEKIQKGSSNLKFLTRVRKDVITVLRPNKKYDRRGTSRRTLQLIFEGKRHTR